MPGYTKWVPAVGIAAMALVIGLLVTDQRDNHLPGDALSEFRSSASVADPFQGQVHYVIDDYPQRISVSRDDRRRFEDKVGQDTLHRINDFQQVRSRVTPVSF